MVSKSTTQETFSFKSITKSAKKGVKNASKSAKKAVDDTKKGVEDTANTVADETEKVADDAAKGIEDIADATLGGIMDAINEIIKVINQLGDFFVTIDEYVQKYTDGLNFLNDVDNAFAMLLTLTVPFYGQLYARFALLGGSMDKPWLFFFALPPLTIVPIIYMMFGYVEDLGDIVPWDSMVWLPLVANAIGSLIALNHPIRNVFKIFLVIGAFMAAYWYKSTQVCENDSKGQAEWSKIALDSIISYMLTSAMAQGLRASSQFVSVIPFIGIPLSMLLEVLPMKHMLFQALSIFMVYVGTNMYNSIDTQCSTTVNNEDLYKLLLAAVFLTIVTSISLDDILNQITSGITNKMSSISNSYGIKLGEGIYENMM